MKIVKIKAAGLRGCTPEGGWANEIKPQDCVHTLVAVYTDEGITGWGSVFTNDGLVQAALQVLEPLYARENPLEPERVSEKLHANTFWMGRGGTITHTISGIDIAMWDISGTGHATTRRQIVRGLLSKSSSPLCFAFDARAESTCRTTHRDPRARLSSIQDWLGTIRPPRQRIG